MKKNAIIAAAVAIVLSLSGGSAYAVGQIARNNAIGEENALNFAYIDAGISPEDAEASQAKFDFEKGKFVYEVEFISNGTKYEYTINSKDGTVIEKEEELLQKDESEKKENVTEADDVDETDEKGNSETSTVSDSTETISVNEAKAIALKKAGLTENEVVFSKAKLENENGKLVYEIEFTLAGKAEYEYDIDSATGEILDQSVEKISVNTTSSPYDADDDYDGDDDDDDDDSAAKSSSNSKAKTTTKAQTQNEQISVDKAKAIALGNAGLSANDVVFSKAKLENEDGKLVYEIEFYIQGEAEYGYEIDSYSGAIIDKDIEPWEADDDD
ncbi:MAG: PepSY domain-containing protein [Clostridiales bacterium]|nr:PepSY domain-containing protein [Clostridiales bacterium]